MISVQLAAIIAAVLFAGLALLHLALSLGAPLGRFAWGGENAVLDTRQRTGSALMVPVMLVFGAMILSRAGVVLGEYARDVDWAVWIIALFLVVNALTSFRSESVPEKRIVGPLMLLLIVLIVVVQTSISNLIG